MQGLKNLLSDTHGILGFALIAAATVLCAMGIMPLDKWQNYSEAIFFGVAGAHAAISVGESISNRGTNLLDHPAVQTVIDAVTASLAKPDADDEHKQPALTVAVPPAPTPTPPQAA